MRPSEAEVDFTFTVMKSENVNTLPAANSVEENPFSLGNPFIVPTSDSDQVNLLTPENSFTLPEENLLKLDKNSSSPSSSSSSGDFEFELVGPDSSILVLGEEAAPNRHNYKNGIPVSSMPRHESPPSNEPIKLGKSPTQSPPGQVMERPADDKDSEYRIPSSIFSRANQADWSVASNESLFSIHTGNASFRAGDQVGWFGRSGELGLHSSDPMLSSIDFTSNQPPSVQAQINKPTELGRNSPAVGVTESKAAETMREVIRENEADASKGKLKPKMSTHSTSFHRSNVSTGSATSFAFPNMTGENKDLEKRTPSQTPLPPASEPLPQSQTPVGAKDVETPKKPQALQQPQMAPLGVMSRWFSCILCRSCCS